MPEDLKLSQIGSSPLPPPFRGLHSPGVRKHCQNYLRLLFPEIVYWLKHSREIERSGEFLQQVCAQAVETCRSVELLLHDVGVPLQNTQHSKCGDIHVFRRRRRRRGGWGVMYGAAEHRTNVREAAVAAVSAAAGACVRACVRARVRETPATETIWFYPSS